MNILSKRLLVPVIFSIAPMMSAMEYTAEQDARQQQMQIQSNQAYVQPQISSQAQNIPQPIIPDTNQVALMWKQHSYKMTASVMNFYKPVSIYNCFIICVQFLYHNQFLTANNVLQNIHGRFEHYFTGFFAALTAAKNLEQLNTIRTHIETLNILPDSDLQAIIDSSYFKFPHFNQESVACAKNWVDADTMKILFTKILTQLSTKKSMVLKAMSDKEMIDLVWKSNPKGYAETLFKKRNPEKVVLSPEILCQHCLSFIQQYNLLADSSANWFETCVADFLEALKNYYPNFSDIESALTDIDGTCLVGQLIRFNTLGTETKTINGIILFLSALKNKIKIQKIKTNAQSSAMTIPQLENIHLPNIQQFGLPVMSQQAVIINPEPVMQIMPEQWVNKVQEQPIEATIPLQYDNKADESVTQPVSNKTQDLSKEDTELVSQLWKLPLLRHQQPKNKKRKSNVAPKSAVSKRKKVDESEFAESNKEQLITQASKHIELWQGSKQYVCDICDRKASFWDPLGHDQLINHIVKAHRNTIETELNQ